MCSMRTACIFIREQDIHPELFMTGRAVSDWRPEGGLQAAKAQLVVETRGEQ